MAKHFLGWKMTPEQQARYDAYVARYNELHKDDVRNWILGYFKDQSRRAKPVIHDKP